MIIHKSVDPDLFENMCAICKVRMQVTQVLPFAILIKLMLG